MCRAACQAVQTTAEVQRAKANDGKKIVRLVDVPLHLLFFGDFTGTANEGDHGAGTDQVVEWNLGDRVVNIRSSFVPFGLRGTIVALHPTTGTVEVIFDTSFIGGNTLHGLCANGRGRVVKWTDLLAVDASNVKAPQALLKKRSALNTKRVTAASSETKETKRSMKKEFTATKKKSNATSKPKKTSSKTSTETKRAPIPVVQELLKKGSDQQHLTSLLSNMQAKNQNPKKSNEQQRLASLLANANKDPSKKKEAAHLNRLLANANRPSAPQQQQQQQQRPPQMQTMMMMPPSPGMQMPMMMPPMMMPPMVGRGMPMMMPPSRGGVTTGAAPLGPMPTSASALGPMPSSSDGMQSGALANSSQVVQSKVTSAKKIPRKKKEAGKSLLMPSQARR